VNVADNVESIHFDTARRVSKEVAGRAQIEMIVERRGNVNPNAEWRDIGADGNAGKRLLVLLGVIGNIFALGVCSGIKRRGERIEGGFRFGAV
jgi:hypothetical protein